MPGVDHIPGQAGGVVEVAEDALEKAAGTMELLGSEPTYKAIQAVLSDSGTGGTGVNATVEPAPEAPADITRATPTV